MRKNSGYRGTVGTEEQRNTRYRGTVGKDEQRVQWNRGTVGTQEQRNTKVQRNSGYLGEIPTLTPMYKFSSARCASGMIMQITRGKSITWTTFNSRTEQRPRGYCLPNQGTQLAQILIHTMNTYALMGQN